jgi:uncharacterized protein (TIGR00290 family)
VEQVLFSWSGGKDSALALQEILTCGKYALAGLLTTVTEDYDRISMHGVRSALLHQQATSLGLALTVVRVPKQAANAAYEERMASALQRHKDAGVTCVAFGDIFLEDLRAYREQNLARMGMRALFPLWKRDSVDIIKSFIGGGFKAVTTCVDGKVLGSEFVGRAIDDLFAADLPAGIDPCGENGEYHSFVHKGPIFSQDIAYRRGDVVLRDDRFWYCDLIPA